MTPEDERRLRRIEQELGLTKLMIGLFTALDASIIAWLARTWDLSRWATLGGIVLAVFFTLSLRAWIIRAYRLLAQMEDD